MMTLLAVMVNEQGALMVQNNEPDLLKALGLCDVAKDAIKAQAQRQTQTPQILLARGNLPPLNGHGEK